MPAVGSVRLNQCTLRNIPIRGFFPRMGELPFFLEVHPCPFQSFKRVHKTRPVVSSISPSNLYWMAKRLTSATFGANSAWKLELIPQFAAQSVCLHCRLPTIPVTLTSKAASSLRPALHGCLLVPPS